MTQNTKKARKQIVLRLSPELYDALTHWADDEFRSINGQIEYLLTDAVRQAGREKKTRTDDEQKNKPLTSVRGFLFIQWLGLPS